MRVRQPRQLLLDRDDRRAIIKFFSLSDSQRRKIQRYGVGARWILVPGSLGSYPRHFYPQLYSNGEGKNGRFPKVKLGGRNYIVMYRLSEDIFEEVRGLQGAVVIPNTYGGRNILSFL